MKHGSLFSGMGGFDLAAEWMGWENVFHCEWNEFGQKILKYYWPKAISYGDITKTDFTPHRGAIDLLSGGFPCQPYSQAGKRLGKEDERHLWPEMLRAIREIQPRWIVGENVSGIVNWNGGMVFREVCADLENEGFEVVPFLLPACSKNAPHRRERCWFIAHTQGFGNNGKFQHGSYWQPDNSGNGEGIRGEFGNNGEPGSSSHPPSLRRGGNDWERAEGFERGTGGASCNQFDGNGGQRIPSDTNPSGCGQGNETLAGRSSKQLNGLRFQQDDPNALNQGLQGGEQSGSFGRQGAQPTNQQPGRPLRNTWEKFPTQPPVCSGNDGLPTGLDGITLSKWRKESIKAAGNAVVPQVVHEIFKAVEKYEQIYTSRP